MNKNIFQTITTDKGINNNANYIQGTNTIINTNNSNDLTKRNMNKRVTFNDEVIIYNVKSYKEHNKKFCYNEDETYQHLYNKTYGYNNSYSNVNKYLNKYKNNNNISQQNGKDKSDCCCIIL